MSFQAMTWATEQELPAMQKIVLLMMANRTNHDTGLCFPSHERLAKECGMDKRSVIRQIGHLECAGLLDVLRSSDERGMKTVNKYRLNLSVSAKQKAHETVVTQSHSVVTQSHQGSDTESLGVVTQSHQGSDTESLGVVTQSHQGSDTESHKPVIEPVNQPVIEPKDSAIAQPAQKKKLSESKKVKESITSEWTPSVRCLALLGKSGIDSAFAHSLVEEFILYWEERGDKRAGWDATFLGFVKRESERKRPKAYQSKQPGQRPIYEYTPSNHDFDSMRTIEGEVI